MAARSVKHGYDFEREVSNSLKLLQEVVGNNLWFMKLVDTHSFDKIKVVFKGNTNPEKLIIPKVPADHLCVYNGKPTFIECKSTKMERWNPVLAISEHQLLASQVLELAGATYFFFVCDRRKPRNHRMLVFTGVQMRELCRRLQRRQRAKNKKKGDSTYTWDELDATAMLILEKQKGSVWELNFIIGGRK